MEKVKVLVTSRIPRKEREYIVESLKDDFQFILPETYKKEELLELTDKNVKIVLGNYIDEDLLKAGSIDMIQNPFAGVENFDFPLLRKYGVGLCNSHSNAEAVAEHALGLMLSIGRKIPYHHDLLKEGKWNRDQKEENIFSVSLRDKKIGIIGYGEIGRSLARLLEPFNPSLMAIVRNKNKTYDELDFLGDMEDLDYVMEEADFLVLAVPLTEKTKGLINEKNIAKMKDTAFIINVSRGRIIEEEAIYKALKERKIQGAAIDTWYNYPEGFKGDLDPSIYPIHKLNNVVLSPHRAAMVKGEFTNAEDVITNLKEYMGDKNFINRVNIEEGY